MNKLFKIRVDIDNDLAITIKDKLFYWVYHENHHPPIDDRMKIARNYTNLLLKYSTPSSVRHGYPKSIGDLALGRDE